MCHLPQEASIYRYIVLAAALVLATPIPGHAQTLHERPQVEVPTRVAPVAKPRKQQPIATNNATAATNNATAATNNATAATNNATVATNKSGRITANPRAIKQLEQLIAHTDAIDPEFPPLLHRLADMYANTATFWRYKAERAIDDEPQSATHRRQANEAERRALTTYKRLVTEPAFATYRRIDEVLFAYAATLQRINRHQQARQLYKRLVTSHPQSKFVPDVYLAFADHYFESNDLQNAQRFYEKALTFPKSRVYAYAMYKQGWVHMNLGEPHKAMSAFASVTQDAGPHQLALARAARDDFVRAYAGAGKPENAHAAFQELDSSDAFRLLQALAPLYADQGRYNHATTIYRKLIKLAPRDARVCDWQLQIARGTTTIGIRSDVVTEVHRAAKTARMLGGETCRDAVRVHTGELARQWHVEGLRTRRDVVLEHGDRVYQAYTRYFPDAPDLSETRYYHAELVWVRARRATRSDDAHALWLRAATMFDRVANDTTAMKAHRDESRDAATKARANAAAI